MIWAPLRWLAPKLLALLIAVAVVALVAGIFVYGSPFAIGAGVGLYVLFGLTVAAYMADRFVLTDGQTEIGPIIKYDQLDGVLIALIMLVAIPVTVPIFAVALIIGTTVYAVHSLHEDYDAFSGLRRSRQFIKKAVGASVSGVLRAIKWFFRTHFSERWWLAWIRPFLVIPAGFAVVGFWHSWAMLVALMLFGLTGMVYIILWLSYLADKSVEHAKNHRENMIRSECDKFFRNLFALQHPKQAGDEKRYQKWFARYRQHIKQTYDEDVYGTYMPYWYLFDRSIKLGCKYVEAYGQLGSSFLGIDVQDSLEAAVVRRSKRKSSAVEFLAFIWSVVLVNKWKICPIVEVPERG